MPVITRVSRSHCHVKKAEWTVFIIGRFADGKLAEDWVEYDRLGLYRQLGIIPLGG